MRQGPSNLGQIFIILPRQGAIRNKKLKHFYGKIPLICACMAVRILMEKDEAYLSKSTRRFLWKLLPAGEAERAIDNSTLRQSVSGGACGIIMF